ncbi:hypothetical protein [Nocardiopsis alborubida]|uniref:Uncharacterized protein n=1 Tax=Nocardiopsis alborubida TaxID=146802 RepID=A0A7X6MBT4_9ACTN|nr:hypothetical protein [Nocardiopsis alborubida]NKY98030.1 hypothetical protein [Nocardiopsis alborubida]
MSVSPTPVWQPASVNLCLGVFAMVPLFCAHWLITYLPRMDCRSIDDMEGPNPGNCTYQFLDHYPPVLGGLFVFGFVLLLLVLLVNVLVPLKADRNVFAWLAWTPLIAVPYLLLYLNTAG